MLLPLIELFQLLPRDAFLRNQTRRHGSNATSELFLVAVLLIVVEDSADGSPQVFPGTTPVRLRRALDLLHLVLDVVPLPELVVEPPELVVVVFNLIRA